jgi:hypothetical protein
LTSSFSIASFLIGLIEQKVAFHLIATEGLAFQDSSLDVIFSAIDFISSVFTFRLLNIQELVWISHEIEKFHLITIEVS